MPDPAVRACPTKDVSSTHWNWKILQYNFAAMPGTTATMKSEMPKIDMATVGMRLEGLRKALALEKGAFADSFGLDPSSYSKVINGNKPLKSEHAFTIAERWGVTMDFIYRGDMSRISDTMRKSIMAAMIAE
jgi:hypothetical protein